MQINANFDSGNIEVVSLEQADDIQLRIKKDSDADFMQWFYFRLSGVKDKDCRLKILNAHEATYVEGWQDYQAVVSYDREQWLRAPTQYDGKSLKINFTAEYDVIYIAYFAPYSAERHQDLITEAQLSPLGDVEDLGTTVDGRPLTLLRFGQPDADKLNCWFIARQHPGESMAEWFMEGFIDRLSDLDDALAQSLLENCVFYCVPNMNPDGSVRGNLRSNAAGANLNREWQAPTLERSPEVYLVRQKMQELGVDFFLDVHGDEAIPYNFLAGCEGNPSYNERIQSLEELFRTNLLLANPDFQNKHGYPVDKSGEGNLSMATNYIGEYFNCLSFTLEMPFKDNANRVDLVYGWSPTRSIKMGRSILHPLNAVVQRIKVNSSKS